MSDFLIAFIIVIIFSVVGLGFLFTADRGRGYNFWDMDDGRDDDEQS